MRAGCFTAIATPFMDDGAVDYDGLDQLAEFQITNGITGIVAVGTTGESPVLSWDEHNKVIEAIAKKTKGRCLCIAGTGSNNTTESFEATKHAAEVGADAVLLVDPYYNGPSSLEIRREYVTPIAAANPNIKIIPFIIPGRTGAQMLPEDLAILYKSYPNVSCVKEATANLENMRRTRQCCGDNYTIMSGDDGMTYEMMIDPEIKAAGTISVTSNVAPKALTRMVELLNEGNQSEANTLMMQLQPLFSLVTVTTTEKTPYGDVSCRARNPSAYKAMLAILGMPSGGCRPPLGRLTENGLNVVLDGLRRVYSYSPEILRPIEEFFNVDIGQRLEDPKIREGLYYKNY
ncbi:MAG: 4-hydroxy-tetrahydrodipicolinate synthase [Deltaproteobacteria bacterium]|nr:4-hydroxy-tetrahydrodipicolinate synthase [Deltaproteobacteria bacterium]